MTMKSNTKTTKKVEKRTALGLRIERELRELLDTIQSGVPLESRYTVYTVRKMSVPKEYGPKDVKFTRAKIGASQAIFAQLVGVSTKLVQSWEQGERKPQKIARRLLDEINANPERWKQMMQPQAAKLVRAETSRKKKSA